MADNALRLTTERLVLIPFGADFIEALAEREAAQQLIDAIIPDGWPDAELAGLLRVYGPWVAADPSRLGYGPLDRHRARPADGRWKRRLPRNAQGPSY